MRTPNDNRVKNTALPFVVGRYDKKLETISVNISSVFFSSGKCVNESVLFLLNVRYSVANMTMYLLAAYR